MASCPEFDQLISRVIGNNPPADSDVVALYVHLKSCDACGASLEIPSPCVCGKCKVSLSESEPQILAHLQRQEAKINRFFELPNDEQLSLVEHMRSCLYCRQDLEHPLVGIHTTSFTIQGMSIADFINAEALARIRRGEMTTEDFDTLSIQALTHIDECPICRDNGIEKNRKIFEFLKSIPPWDEDEYDH
ncbi:MAG: hypothetical protein ABH837_01760 [bacterium]